MDYVLLKTKLYMPPVHAQKILRYRLLERLQHVSTVPLTLVVAPAGFGKTTLLSEWCATSQRAVAWLSLDKSDNDLTFFWQYVIAALNTLQPGIGESALELLFSAHPPPINTILTVLINALTAFSCEMVLVLDDYQMIEEQTLHETMTFFLDHLPPHMHLVLSSRAEPALPLARLRSQRALLELRTPDLRFTLEETHAFFHQTMRIMLSQEAICALESRTEGWIAGLQLAALSLQEYEKREDFLASFLASLPHRYIIDYLVEEVLQQQSASMRDFLLRTSILERMNGALCNALTGQSDGHEMLQHLERKNVFLVPLDNQSEWYRYHHLFAEVLRRSARHQFPDLIPLLHQKASNWYACNGYPIEAIEHALAAPDYLQAAIWLEQRAQANEAIWRWSELTRLLRWLQELPEALLDARPQLCLLSAWTSLGQMAQSKTGNRERIEARLHDAERHLDVEDTSLVNQEMRGELAAMRATLAYIHNDGVAAVTQGKRALELLPQDHFILRSQAAQMLVNAYRFTGDLSAAQYALEELMALSERSNDSYSTQHTLYYLGLLSTTRGDLKQAAVFHRQAIALSSQLPIEAVSPYSHLGLGWILLEWDQREAALPYVMKGIELAKRKDASAVLYSYETLRELHWAQGEIEAALLTLDELEQFLSHSRLFAQVTFTPHIKTHIEAYRAQLHLVQEDLDAANHWALHYVESEELTHVRLLEHGILARVHLAHQRTEQALLLLPRLTNYAEGTSNVDMLIPLLALQALALWAHGETERAMNTLARALVLAQPGGYIRSFVKEGLPMRTLLEEFRATQIQNRSGAASPSCTYVDRLLAAFGVTPIRAIAKEQPSPAKPTILSPAQQGVRALKEPLSAREVEVLRLMDEGLSDQQIAQRLVLSITTVKTHARHIYTKLEVNNRRQATWRARELFLL